MASRLLPGVLEPLSRPPSHLVKDAIVRNEFVPFC
jgi:hypothetical protein